MTALFVMLLSLIPIAVLDAGWLERKAEGWAWYEITEEEKIEEPKEAPLPQTSSEILSKMKQELEENLSKALLDPTKENVRTYMINQQRWIQQSAKFAQIWTQNLLVSPKLDPTTIDYPVSQYGI